MGQGRKYNTHIGVYSFVIGLLLIGILSISVVIDHRSTINLGIDNTTERNLIGPIEPDNYQSLSSFDYSGIWNRTYGGFADDRIYDMTKCADGGFALVGTTRSFAESDVDIWVIRTDPDGDVIWTTTLGGPGGEDSGRSIIECDNGDLVIAGYSPSAADFDGRIDRLDENGNLIWTTLIGEPAGFDYLYDVIETGTGCILATGRTDSWGASGNDVLVVCLDSNGNEIWIRIYGGGLDDTGKSVIECSSGGYAILANTLSYGAGNMDFWLLRLDINGELQWAYPFGGAGKDESFDLVEYYNDIVMVGSTASLGDPAGDICAIRVSSVGAQKWFLSYSGAGQDMATGIIKCYRGGFAIVGITDYLSAVEQTRIIRIEPDGTEMWSEFYGGYNTELCYCIEEVYPEEFAVAGGTNTYGAGSFDAWLFLVPGMPRIQNYPSDQFFEYGEFPYVDIFVESTAEIDMWWLDDTSVFNIAEFGGGATVYSMIPTAIGIFEINAHVNNTAGYEVSMMFFIHVNDFTSPHWTVTPQNQTVEFGELFQYQLYADDLSGLDEWLLSGSSIFVVDGTGEITSTQPPAVGSYILDVSVDDIYFNTLTTRLCVNVQDTTSPEWDETPQDTTIMYGSQFVYDLNASDLSGISTWYVDNPEFSVDWEGRVRNLVILAPGEHGVTVYASDEYGNTLQGRFVVTVETSSIITTTTGITTDLLGTAIPFAAGVGATVVVVAIVVVLGKKKTK